MRKTRVSSVLCWLLVLGVVAAFPTVTHAWTVSIADPGHTHDCDSPSGYGNDIHTAHGPENCGNSHGVTGGAAETCQDVNTTARGQLLNGQWLACGANV